MKGNERKRERTERKRKERNESETFHYKAMTKLNRLTSSRDLGWMTKRTRKLPRTQYPVFRCLIGCHNREWSHLICVDLNETAKNMCRLGANLILTILSASHRK